MLHRLFCIILKISGLLYFLVFVFSGNCRSRDGIRKALDRKEAIELLLEDFGLEPERFSLEHIAASEGPKFAKVVKDMTDELSSLGPSPYR